MEWLLRIISADCFQTTCTPDPVLNEKRAREKRILVSFVAALFSMLWALILRPTETVATDSILVMTGRLWEMVHIGAIILCLLSAVWGLIESIGYRLFLRKWN